MNLIYFIILCCSYLFSSVFALSCPLLSNCNGHGQCASSGASCLCSQGFEGETCAIPPVVLTPEIGIPGFLGPKQLSTYMVEFEKFRVGDEVIVEMDEGTVDAYIQVGTAPEAGVGGVVTQYQAKDLKKDRDDNSRRIIVNTVAPVPEDSDDLNLYITVAALSAGPDGGATFEVKFKGQGFDEQFLIPGIDNWAAIVIISMLGVLGISLTVFGIFIALMLFRKGPPDYNAVQAAVPLSTYNASSVAAGPSAVYNDPSLDPNANGYLDSTSTVSGAAMMDTSATVAAGYASGVYSNDYAAAAAWGGSVGGAADYSYASQSMYGAAEHGNSNGSYANAAASPMY